MVIKEYGWEGGDELKFSLSVKMSVQFFGGIFGKNVEDTEPYYILI